MNKIAVIIYGPPGAGKGTQAELLAKALNIVHFDIGAYLEQVIYDPKNSKNKFIQTQKKVFESGEMCDSNWVFELVSKRVRQIANADLGIVLSGSLRTLTEAFGEGGRIHGLLEVLEKSYGKANIKFFVLKVPPSVSLRRNSRRLICTICHQPMLLEYLKEDPKQCLFCGGPLKKRTLDNPKTIKRRLLVFKNETLPLFKKLKERHYSFFEISGEGAAYLVHKKILKYIYKK